ncbi:MAG: Sec-independent protein translocase protein TatB [Pelagimonas sp.]|uniref:Sec-independent protein translocase subunit TatA/TatB n=1 Tax=Pelagimonas sp. TaxID=2073170 RepID=UPI003D6B38A7
MFDFSMGELLVVGTVALIVVGPKDLPKLFRNVGQFVGKARGMAREFSKAMNDAADTTGVGDVAKSFKAATNPLGTAMDGVKDAAKSITDIDPNSQTGKLSKEREEAKKKIEANAARVAAERKAREAEEATKKAKELEASLKRDDSAADAGAGSGAAGDGGDA